jgi:DNA polymerase I-like protein with 3'-5' exonuclease and polymerase domains
LIQDPKEQRLIVAIDFETFYDVDYTLKKMSTSEYIRDARFEAISCAIKIGAQPTNVYWGSDVGPALRDAFGHPLSNVDMLAHHAHFEGLILSHHYDIYPRAYRDTLSMARGLFPKTGRNDLGSLAERLGVQNKLAMPGFMGFHLADIPQEMREAIALYNAADVDSCVQAYEKLLLMLPARELDVIDITVRMFAQPRLELDLDAAKTELARERKAKADAIAKAQIDAADLTKNVPFAAALVNLGIEPPKKKSKTTGKDIYAFAQTDVDFTSLTTHPDPLVAALVEARLAAKSTIGETRAQRLIKAGSPPFKLPVYLNYCAAHTLRWSGGDKINFQNFPRSGELRRTILAPPGHVMVVVDSRQMHPRILAWLSGEKWMLDEFTSSKGDPYSVFASMIYGVPVSKDNPAQKEMRQVGKVCVLALGFGMGAYRLKQTLAWGIMSDPVYLPLEVCAGLVNTYRHKSPNVTSFWETMTQAIGDMYEDVDGSFKCLSWGKDKVLLPDGMTLHYPSVSANIGRKPLGAMFPGRYERWVSDASYGAFKGRSKLYGGLMTENVVQALERVIMAEQLVKIAARYRVVMMSHDEIVFLAREREADEAMQFGMGVIRTRPSWGPDLPLDAEGGFATNYSK